MSGLPPGPVPSRRRLESWKEIAAYLNRTVRTVQRWERDEELPVHRHTHQKLASVYAYTDEIDRWWEQSHGGLLGAGADASGDTTPGLAWGDDMEAAADQGAVGRVDAPADAAVAVAEVAPGVPRMALARLAAAVVVVAVAGGGLVAWRYSAAGPVGGASASSEAPNADAHNLYARGREFWKQRTPRGFEQARLTFERAVALDPQHARAHAGLADTYSLLEAFGLMPAAEALSKARASAERALQLAPDLGEAHASLAFVLWEQHDTTGAMAQIERALQLDPDYATAHHWYGLFLQQFLRRDEAIQHVRQAVTLDPAQPIFWTELAGMLTFARRNDEAREVLEQARTRHPGFPDIYIQLSKLAQQRGDHAAAVALLRRAVALGDNRPRVVASLACLEAETGNTGAAVETLQVLRAMVAAGEHVPDDAVATLSAITGDLDAVFRLVDRGIEQREEWVAAFFGAPGCLVPVRRDARWRGVVQRLEQASWLPLGSRLPPRDATQAAP